MAKRRKYSAELHGCHVSLYDFTPAWVPAGILIASAWVDDFAYWAGTVSIGRSGSAAHSCSEAV